LYPTLDIVHRVRLRIAPAGLNRSCYKTSFPQYLTSDTPSPNSIRIATENSLVAQQRKSRMLRRVFGDTLNNDNGLRSRYHHQRHIESCRKGTPPRSLIFSYCRQTTNYLVKVLHIIPCSIEVSSRPLSVRSRHHITNPPDSKRSDILDGVLGLERLHPSWTSQARKVIGDQNPWSATIKVEMKLWITVYRTFYVCERNVDLVRVLLRFTKEGTPTTTTKGTSTMRRRRVATQLVTPSQNFELSWWNSKPRDERCPMVPSTH